MNYLDLACTIALLCAIYMVPKHYKWWLMYSFSAVLWTALCYSKDLWFGVATNILLFAIGIRNFLKGRGKHLKEASKTIQIT